jgi:hypothetical protein
MQCVEGRLDFSLPNEAIAAGETIASFWPKQLSPV